MSIHDTAILAAGAAPSGTGVLNGLVVLAFAVAVLGCCLVFAAEDHEPSDTTGAAGPTHRLVESGVRQRPTHLRVVPDLDARGAGGAHRNARPRTLNADSATVNVTRGAEVGT